MKKDKLLAIGEALIDFAPKQIGVPLKDVSEFKKVVGGAPANVCGAFSKLGGCSRMITQLGKDPFGDCIVEELEGYGIDTSLILRTAKANTALAFVSLKADGGRALVYDRGGKKYYLYSKDSELLAGNTDYAIITGDVNREGTVALATAGQGYLGQVSV